MILNQRIDGTITRANGVKSNFAITPDGSQQWGASTAELGDTVELVDAMRHAADFTGFLEPPAEPEERRGITLTRDQLEAWACRTLTDEEVDELDYAIPNSTIPETIDTIVDNL